LFCFNPDKKCLDPFSNCNNTRTAVAAAYILDCIRHEAEKGMSRYTVCLKESGQLIGFCGFKETDGYIDFGRRYSKEYWRQGYGTVAAAAVLEYSAYVEALGPRGDFIRGKRGVIPHHRETGVYSSATKRDARQNRVGFPPFRLTCERNYFFGWGFIFSG